ILALGKARKIEKKDHPRLFNIVEEMQVASGLPKLPDIYIIDDQALNAFATGRDPEHSAIAVTAGLLNVLNRDELQGVIAHELAHIKNRDTLLMLMTGVMLGAIVIIANLSVRSMFFSRGSRRSSSSGGGQAQLVIMLIGLVLMIVAPIIAQIIYFSISRKREYLADASSALFTRYPDGLASALEKISGSSQKLTATSQALLPMYIINPLSAVKRKASSVLRTHPPVAERIRILRGMGGVLSLAEYNQEYRKVSGNTANLVAADSLPSIPPVEKRGVGTEKAAAGKRHQETNDLLWRMNNYSFLKCACGMKLKLPPKFKKSHIPCPRCGRQHNLTGK
ncbi:M48 family metallopeptidase, partial [bacterium]|nr:M48 family metallopeptidase [bacterium]